MFAETSRRKPFAILGLAAALGMPSAQTRSLSVMPNPAPADKPFTLYLQGVPIPDCSSGFARESVTVSGDRIDLRYTVVQYAQPEKASGSLDACPVQALPDAAIPYRGPAFSLPALKAGKYEVWATSMPECLYSQPACKIAVKPESAGVLEVKGEAPPGYAFNPVSARAGQAFSLHLLSYLFTCGTTYDSVSAAVQAGAITLTFLDHPNPAALCPAIYAPYGPVFRIPALTAGRYSVKVQRLPESTVVDAGILAITDKAPHNGWYLKEKTVPADQAFSMQLLRDDIGNCQTTFAEQRITVSARSVAVFFVMERHPERICIQDLRPFGPTFQMPAMQPGIYPVSAAACEGDVSLCDSNPTVALVVDTLIVSQTVSARLSELRAQAPRVELRGSKAIFELPAGGQGTWRAELMSLDGRVLGQTTWTGKSGQQAALPVGRAPANAVSLLRLTSPAGSQRVLPILR